MRSIKPDRADTKQKAAKPSVAGSASEMDVLRSLLLADERNRAELQKRELEERLEKLVGQDEFLETLTQAMSVALRDAEQRNPRAVAKAISPAVLKSIRREMVNSRDEMVEALYPITGRLVRAAVSDAMSSFAADVNRRLDAMTSPSFLAAKAKSFIHRRPVAEFLIADLTAELVLERALLIDRQSGALLHVWHADEQEAEDADDADLVSGMFAAISSFASEKYGSEHAELRTLDLNGTTVALLHSARLILVVEHEGVLTVGTRERLDDLFSKIVSLSGDTAALAQLDPLATANDSAASAPKKRGKLKRTAVFALPILCGLLAWTAYDRYWFADRLADLDAEITEQLGVHNLAVSADRRSRNISIGGPVPMAFDVRALEQALSGTGIEFNDMTFVVPQDLTLRQDLTALIAEANSTLLDVTSRTQSNAERFERNIDESREAARAIGSRQAEMAAEQSRLRTDLQAQLSAFDQRENAQNQASLARISRVDANNAQQLAGLRSELGDEVQASHLANISAREKAYRDMQTELGSAVSAIRAQIDDRMATQTTLTSQELAALAEKTRQLEAVVNGELSQVQTSIEDELETFANDLQSRNLELQELFRTQGQLEAIEVNAIRLVEMQSIALARGTVPIAAEQARLALSQIALLAQVFDLRVSVLGYSDASGTASDNQDLSDQRAQWGAEQLVELGVRSAKITAQGLGSAPDPSGKSIRQIRFLASASDEN